MKFPCEIILEPYITHLRSYIAKFLKVNGLSQIEIASLLQVSQPVISGYLKKSQEFNDYTANISSEAKKVGTQIGEILLEKGIQGVPQSLMIGCKTCKILRMGGMTCAYHKYLIPPLEDDCIRCHTQKEILDLQIDRENVLNDLREIFLIISDTRSSRRIIPEIGLQIVLGTHNFQNISEVAGFPDRIMKQKENAPVTKLPAFGSSETASNLLLEIKKYVPNISALAGIKTTDWMISKLEEKNLKYLEIEEFDKYYKHKLPKVTSKLVLPMVIVDKGSVGLEAISYVITKSGKELKKIFSQLV